MEYAFLTMLIPEQMVEDVADSSTQNMPDAANALQWHIYEGFCANFNEPIKLFNVLPIGSFPQYYSKPFIKKTGFNDKINNGNINHINIGFCNVKLIKKFHQPKKIFAQLKKWCMENRGDKTLFVYSASAPLMIAVAKLKKRFPELAVCTIIADLPDMFSLSSKKSWVQKQFEKKLAADSYSAIGCVDAFALLTKQMADYMKIDKPFVVMEGISTFYESQEKKERGNTKTILYTGTLHKRFGVLNLVEAFRMIDDPDYRLVICGVGDCEGEITEHARADSRIEFKGQMRREDILSLQQEATVLVNPRQNNEEFTKYSFPSKNLEYLSSGVPLVAYKLDGIPDEYDEHINYVEDNSIEALRDKLVDVCEDVTGSARERAVRAVTFVRTEKNAQKQTVKIKQMLDTL